MKSSLEALEGNKVKLSVTIDETEFDRDIDQAFRRIAREVRIPGFRAGKVPRRVLEARIGVAPAREQALRDAIPEYLRKAVVEHEVDLIATPEVEITSGEEAGPVDFDATCEVRPEVVVPGYEGLRVELPNPAATDDEVEAELTAELRRHGTLSDLDRPAERGDFVTLDLAATRDGEPVTGLNTEDWSYEVGQGWIADDFDDRIVGASAGAELAFTTTPKGTSEEADFTVTVQKVQELVPPELTDEWVSENLGEFETVAEWRESVRERIAAGKLEQARNVLIGKTTEGLVALGEFEVPEPLVRSEMQRRVEQTVRQLAAQGINVEQFLGATGQDPQAFVENFRPQAEQAVKVDLALRAVATAQGIEIDDDDIEAEYQHLSLHIGQKPKQIRKAYEANGLVPELKAQIRKTKALDWLLENVEIVDEAGEPLDREPLIAGRHHEHDEELAALDDDHDHEGHDHDGHDHDHAES
ncbi:trigger factor [Desertimonas flava]|uniref:trigger factor n=1 Tax=Desertimonas flava TaxID=2064846 RepID=UPI000E356B1F|nr:trigger factor [Desertimonas flava]